MTHIENFDTAHPFVALDEDGQGIHLITIISEALPTEDIHTACCSECSRYFDTYSHVEGLKWELAISPNGIKALGHTLPEVAYALKDSDDITIIEKAIPDWSADTMRLALYGTRVGA